jgi:hypothetical protein
LNKIEKVLVCITLAGIITLAMLVSIYIDIERPDGQYKLAVAVCVLAVVVMVILLLLYSLRRNRDET